jgi:CubicO group peptidase (beta-lactamase class C family)
VRRVIFTAVTLAVLAAVVLGARWIWVGARVGAGYAAKVTCSLALNAGQDPARVMRDYVAHEIQPLAAGLRVDVTPRGAEAAVAGGLYRVRAVHRPGLGCTLVPEDSEKSLTRPQGVTLPRRVLDSALPWPDGAAAPEEPTPPAVAAAIERAFREPDTSSPGRFRQTTAVVVAYDGRLVAERYAPGYGPETPMLSWSMAKSVLASLVGVAVADGRLNLDLPAAVPEWAAPGDPRGAISLDQLLRMSSGLAFDEHYGAVNDVSRMLFTRPDTGAFAAESVLAAAPDTVWSYSSGTTNIVARLLRDSFGGDLAALVEYANERLFDPAGMTSAFFEPDAAGTPIGSSFVFMTARDWARLGELHRRDGVWSGRRILPEGWVRYVTTPTPAAPDGTYGAHWWLNAGDSADPARRMWPNLPTETYAARGHSGQFVIVVPSARLVVARLGLTFPDNDDDGAAELVEDLLRVIGN